MSLGLQKTLSSSFAKPEWNEECELYVVPSLGLGSLPRLSHTGSIRFLCSAVWSDSLDNTLNVELWIVADSTPPQRLAKVSFSPLPYVATLVVIHSADL